MKSGTITNKKNCNCRNKDNCLLDGKCLVECIAYEAIVSTINRTNEGDFKSRYNKHKLSICSKGCKYRTELSKYVWSLKDSNTEISLKWRIKTKAMLYKCV